MAKTYETEESNGFWVITIDGKGYKGTNKSMWKRFTSKEAAEKEIAKLKEKEG